MSNHLLLAGAIAALATGAFAQITPEIEPNETKGQATTNGIITMVPGDSLTGTTTGTSTITPGGASADTWHVKTGALASGIYRHTLAITTTGPAGNIGSIRGLSQTAGAVNPATDLAFQTSSTATTPARSNAWYGFGRGEEIYYRVTGTATTTGTYSATLSTVPVTPQVVPGTFAPGVIVLSTEGLTAIDTDIHLFDSTLTIINDASNDDNSIAEGGSGAGLQSRMTRTLAAGTYYLAIGNWNLGTNDDSPQTDGFLIGNALDFPNVIVGSSTTTTSLDLDLSITDTAGPVAVTVLSPAAQAYSIVFVRFTVGSSIPAPVAYCFGDGSSTACPCGNAGIAGNGCASSVNPNGGNLASSGTSSIGADNLILLGTGMASSSVLYFQGTTQIAALFGDGLRCAGGTVIRLGTKTNIAGASQYPELGDLSVSVRGACVVGDIRNYQAWYRNAAAFCTPSTFNLTNGLNVTWGA